MALKEFDLEFEGTTVHCWEGGSGLPILMLHGSGPGASTLGNWRNVLEPMTERYRVLAADLVGFGLSGRRTKPPYFDLDMWTREGQMLLDRLAPAADCGIVAHSLSTVFAIRLALKNPRVKKLLITGAMGQPYTIDANGIAVWTYPETREQLKATMEVLIHDRSHITDAFLDNRVKVLSDPVYKAYFTGMFGGDKQGYVDAAVIADADLAKVTCDVALVHGRDDLVTRIGDTAIPLMRKLAKADLYAIARCGHGPALEQPGKFMMAAHNLFG